MSLLNVLIPPQNFELIRDRIGEILFVELQNQIALGETLNPTIYVERSSAFDHTELPTINIVVASGNYDNETVKQSDGTYTYIIYVYTGAKGNSLSNGDKKASLKLQRLIGMCRAILKNPQYRLLGYAAPFISRTTVSGFEIGDPQSVNDTENVMKGRITFVVKVAETVELITPNNIDGWFTNVMLEETNEGYIFTQYDA